MFDLAEERKLNGITLDLGSFIRLFRYHSIPLLLTWFLISIKSLSSPLFF